MQLMDERPRLPNFDPEFCRKIFKRSASICLGLFAVQPLILLMVDPGNSHCPGWTIYSRNGSPSPMGFIVAICTGVPAMVLCYGVLRWKSYSEKMLYDSIAGTRPPVFPWTARYRPGPTELNSNRLILVTQIGVCLFGLIPFYFMWAYCIK
jgi:hypothetical protein